MIEPRKKRNSIRKKLGLSETELIRLENYQRRKRHYYRILASIEALIGVLSFMGGWNTGYANRPSLPSSGLYPFLPVLMTANISSIRVVERKRSLLVIPLITLLVIVVGALSGYFLGSGFYTGSAIKYNVYSRTTNS